jgi:hypothetical protein
MSEQKPKYAIISKTPNYTPPKGESPEIGENPHDENQTEVALEGFVYADPELTPGATMHTGIVLLASNPGDFIEEHTHNSDELIFFISTRPDHSLGCEAEIYLDGKKHTFTHTTVVFVPGGITHGPVQYKNWKEGSMNYLMHVLSQPDFNANLGPAD